MIMPAYNAGQFIRQAIASVLQQTYTRWELIVVDDGSTDDTATMVQALVQEDNRIRYLFQENGRQGKARNTGISYAAGDIIAFLDADDAWMPHKIEKQVNLMREHGADLVFADVYVIDEAGVIIRSTWNVRDGLYAGNQGLRIFFEGNEIPLVSAMVKKDCLLAVGGFSESTAVQYGEDYELWLRLLLNGAIFSSTSDRLAQYRVHHRQATSDGASHLQVIKAIAALPVAGRQLCGWKNKAIIKWMRTWIRVVQPADASAVKQVLEYYPYTIPGKLLKYILRVAPLPLFRGVFDKTCSLALKM